MRLNRMEVEALCNALELLAESLPETPENRYESLAGWAFLDAWHAEQTRWLRALRTETERRPDFDRGLGPPKDPLITFP